MMKLNFFEDEDAENVTRIPKFLTVNGANWSSIRSLTLSTSDHASSHKIFKLVPDLFPHLISVTLFPTWALNVEDFCDAINQFLIKDCPAVKEAVTLNLCNRSIKSLLAPLGWTNQNAEEMKQLLFQRTTANFVTCSWDHPDHIIFNIKKGNVEIQLPMTS